VPIKSNISFWVVYGFEIESDFENIKSIVWPVCSYPLLDSYEIELIFSLCRRYFLPVHKVLNLFLPKFVLNRFEKNSFQDVIWIEKWEERIWIEIKNSFYHNASSMWIAELLTQQNISLESTVLIFWDDFWVDCFLKENKYLEKESLIYKNSMTYTKKYRLFLDVLSKKKNILIWTRKILQYNLARYDNIIYFDDALVKYNYNQFEKFKNLDIIEAIIKTKKFNVSFISSVPSVELFFMTKKHSFDYKII
jgi:primosomal protein N'